MLRRLLHLFEFLFRRHRLEDDLDEELQSSFEMLVDRFVQRGMSLPDARRAARLEFEGLAQVKERVRDNLIGSSVHSFLQDTRYAWRGLRRRPSFTVIVVITLALGLGLNTAVFSVFYGVLLRPLPYGDADRLTLVWATFRTRGAAHVSVSGEIFREIDNRQRSMSGIAGIWVTPPRTFTGDPPEQVKAAFVTANFFDVIGVQAARGRTFVDDDKGGPAFVLADGFFRRRFAGDSALIGKTIGNQNNANTLVGVLPGDFQLHFAPEANVPGDVQVFQPWGPGFYEGKNYIVRVVARLNPGVSIAQAQRDMNRVAEDIRNTYPEFSSENLQFIVTGMQADAFRDVQPALIALFAGGTFVLLIGAVNVTSLLMARATDQRKEIALRLALGASRGRILRQLLAEAALLSALGDLAGLGVGWVVFRGLLLIRPERLARLDDTGIMWPVLAFAGAASLTLTALFVLAPLLHSFRIDHNETLRSNTRGWFGRAHQRLGRALVVGEIMLGFLLVTGAGLTSRTLSKIEQVRPGFDARPLLAFQLPGMAPALMAEWEARLATLPGVQSAGAVSHLPLDNTLPNWYGEYRVDRFKDGRPASFTADYRAVTPGYLPTMGVRLIEGRYFDSRDRAGAANVVVVDDYVAEFTWPRESPIGKTIEAEHMTATGTPFELLPSTLVGVVEHVNNHSITRKVRGEIYSPFAQNQRDGYPQTFVLRTQAEPVSLVPAIRALLRQQSPNMAMDKVRPMAEYVDREIAPAGFTAVLGGIFGALSLLLAATGIYGVLDYQISRRRPEMGIRMALGASAFELLALVLREGLVLSVLGIVLGAAVAQLGAGWLGSLLYGVSTHDPVSYGLALFLVPAAALLGCWRPARRAAAANAAEIIREE